MVFIHVKISCEDFSSLILAMCLFKFCQKTDSDIRRFDQYCNKCCVAFINTAVECHRQILQ